MSVKKSLYLDNETLEILEENYKIKNLSKFVNELLKEKKEELLRKNPLLKLKMELKKLPYVDPEEQKDWDIYLEETKNDKREIVSKSEYNKKTKEWENYEFNTEDGKWYNSKEVDTYWDDETDKLMVVKKI